MKLGGKIVAGLFACATALVPLYAGAGDAHAAWSVEPGKFTHSQTLSDGVLTVKVTNTTAIKAGCPLSVYKGSDIAAVQEMAEAVNAYSGGTGTTAAISAARAKISSAQFTDLLTDGPVAAGTTATATWNSGRSDTSYSVFQNCAASDDQGTVIWGAQAYLVTGTGASSGGIGTGSLGSLLPGS